MVVFNKGAWKILLLITLKLASILLTFFFSQKILERRKNLINWKVQFLWLV